MIFENEQSCVKMKHGKYQLILLTLEALNYGIQIITHL